jgi:hypothetical protein
VVFGRNLPVNRSANNSLVGLSSVAPAEIFRKFGTSVRAPE